MLNLHCREIGAAPFSPARSLIGKVPQDKPWSLTRAKRNREGGNACRDCVQAQRTSLLLQLGRKKKWQQTAITCLKHSTVQGKPIPHPPFVSTGIKLLRAKAPWNSSQVPGAVQAADQCRMCALLPRYNGSLFAAHIPYRKQVFKRWKVCYQNLPCSVNSLNTLACPRGLYYDRRMNDTEAFANQILQIIIHWQDFITQHLSTDSPSMEITPSAQPQRRARC